MSPLFLQLSITFFVAIALPLSGFAQSTKLPRTSQTIYKCVASGKVIYSDEPCPGAEKIDAKPSNGFSKWSGHERVGSKIQHERLEEKISDALKPITGMNPQQFKQYKDRLNLSAETKLKCQSLDESIAESEATEQSAQGADKTRVQRTLYQHRRQYRELRC